LVSDEYTITNGLSPLLYQFYNAGFLDLADEANGELAVGFIDDRAYLTIVDSPQEANEKLRP
jgi:hypothetical protein